MRPRQVCVYLPLDDLALSCLSPAVPVLLLALVSGPSGVSRATICTQLDAARPNSPRPDFLLLAIETKDIPPFLPLPLAPPIVVILVPLTTLPSFSARPPPLLVPPLTIASLPLAALRPISVLCLSRGARTPTSTPAAASIPPVARIVLFIKASFAVSSLPLAFSALRLARRYAAAPRTLAGGVGGEFIFAIIEIRGGRLDPVFVLESAGFGAFRDIAGQRDSRSWTTRDGCVISRARLGKCFSLTTASASHGSSSACRHTAHGYLTAERLTLLLFGRIRLPSASDDQLAQATHIVLLAAVFLLHLVVTFALTLHRCRCSAGPL